jgi:hypothetical protein
MFAGQLACQPPADTSVAVVVDDHAENVALNGFADHGEAVS